MTSRFEKALSDYGQRQEEEKQATARRNAEEQAVREEEERRIAAEYDSTVRPLLEAWWRENSPQELIGIFNEYAQAIHKQIVSGLKKRYREDLEYAQYAYDRSPFTNKITGTAQRKRNARAKEAREKLEKGLAERALPALERDTYILADEDELSKMGLSLIGLWKNKTESGDIRLHHTTALEYVKRKGVEEIIFEGVYSTPFTGTGVEPYYFGFRFGDKGTVSWWSGSGGGSAFAGEYNGTHESMEKLILSLGLALEKKAYFYYPKGPKDPGDAGGGPW